MLWSDAPYAGFSTVEPWLPLGESWSEIHVERQSQRPDSVFALYRALLDLRRREPALWRGHYVPVAATETLLAYERRADSARLLVILELSGRGGALTTLPGTIVLATDRARSGTRVGGALMMSPNEGLIIRLTG
jgi:alpha-glucosidase